jgi:hypothetical protein
MKKLIIELLEPGDQKDLEYPDYGIKRNRRATIGFN